MDAVKPLAVGIDLGTTFSALAVLDNGKPQVVPDTESNRLTPSVILFGESGDVIVGRLAKQNAVAQPERVVEFVKREMGRPASEFSRTIDGVVYNAEQLSSFILIRLKQEAEQVLQRKIKKAVITVPAYFKDTQRVATRRAGELAGLEVQELIDEPVAAAVAFTYNNQAPDGRLMVFDLGGGTLDVTIVEKRGKDLKVLATDGDHQLGGKDWDDCIIKYAAGKFEEKYQTDPLMDPSSYQDMQLRAIQTKEALSRMPRNPHVVQFKGQSLTLDITREKFREIAGPLISRCRFICDEALKQARLSWSNLDMVLLVGGSTRMPMIREMIKAAHGKDPAALGNPDEAVALGAAVTAGYYADQKEADSTGLVLGPQQVRVAGCTAHSLGTICKESDERGAPDMLSIIIRRGSPVKGSYRERYQTLYNNQTEVLFEIVEGETLESTAKLGEIKLTGLPAGPAGRPLSLSLGYDASHVLTATARDLTSNTELTVRIARASDLVPHELVAVRQAVLTKTVL